LNTMSSSYQETSSMSVVRRLGFTFVVAGLSGLLLGPVSAADAKRPNILLIFGDDIGIDGFGCYGSDRSKSLTPNIDALSKSGTRFERCYSTPLCGPSRCVIMT